MMIGGGNGVLVWFLFTVLMSCKDARDGDWESDLLSSVEISSVNVSIMW